MLTCVTPVTSDQGSPGAGDKTIHPFTGPDQPPLSALLPAWSQWADNGCSELTPARPPVVTPTPGSAPPSHVRVCRSSPGFSCIELPGGRRDPLAVTFLSADTVFVLPVFLSLSNSVLHSIHFLFFSLPPLFFEQRQKKLNKEDQALNWITPTPNELLNVFLWFSSFQLEPGSQSLTLWIMWERGRGEWGPIKQLSSLLVN